MKNTRELACACLGTAITIALFYVGLEPAAGRLFDGWPLQALWHYTGHVAIFALLGLIWTAALPRAAPVAVAAGIVAFGFLHEALEIAGHAHRFEIYDACADGLGAIVGVLAANTAFEAVFMPPRRAERQD